MLAQLTQIELRPCGARIFERHARWRMWPGPCICIRGAVAHLNDVGNAVPLTIKLADLLLIHVERQSDLMIMLCRFGLHYRQIERTA